MSVPFVVVSELIEELNIIADLLHKDSYIYFVATDGIDTSRGTLEHPLRTITAALGVVQPGDTIIVRGGVYHCSRTIHINSSGKQNNPICLKAYPGEMPVLDFSDAKGDSVLITGAYWHLKGLAITKGSAAGVIMRGANAQHNILEQMKTFDNILSGIMITDRAAHNIVLNCDSTRNFDPDGNGENAQGFELSFFVGKGNILIGNRSWNNSDDGYDLWGAGHAVQLERCYSWQNGENIWNHPYFSGNGNGFKLGRGEGRHVLINCIAWNHRASGFDSNANDEGVILRNCTGWDNVFSNYCFKYGGKKVAWEDMILRNNVSYGSSNSINARVDSQSNNWDADLGIALTDDDFLSLDDSQMSAPRNPDGSIPQNDFLKLAPGSAAIDKGVDIGMPFVGARPDLGAFEYDPNETSEGYVKMLHQAVRDHDVKQIEQLLAEGEGINDKDWLGYTPLHWAVYFGYPDLIELLISKGADPDIQSDTGRYALEIARAMAYPKLEALLRKLGAKAGDVSPEESLVVEVSIHAAVQSGDQDKVESLLAQGIDINVKDDKGNTPLFYAIRDGHDGLAQFLIDQGADINYKDKDGFGLIYYAIWSKLPAIVEVLAGRGVDVNPAFGDYSPLHYAIWNQDVNTVKLLVDYGARFNEKDPDGWTAFYNAVWQGNREIVDFLVSKGADISSFHMTAAMGDVAGVKTFLDQGSAVDTKDEMECTPLFWATCMGQVEVVKLLIAQGADVNLIA